MMVPMPAHLSEDHLERYPLGTITAEGELAALEEDLLICPDCIRRAESGGLRGRRGAVTIEGNFDQE